MMVGIVYGMSMWQFLTKFNAGSGWGSVGFGRRGIRQIQARLLGSNR